MHRPDKGLGPLFCGAGPISETQPDDLVEENHYYDGVRRIQTIVHVPAQWGGGLFGEFGDFFGDGGGFPGSHEWVERGYVYGPDYVDEFILQDEDGVVAYMLQDADYNVVALLDANGAKSTGSRLRSLPPRRKVECKAISAAP